MELYFVRHTAVSVEKNICYGQSDVALADTFETEAMVIQEKLPASFCATYSSPLSRCMKLAMRLQKKQIELEPRLMEMHFGDWENANWNNIHPSELNPWMEDFVHTKTPNGENLEMLYARIIAFIEELRTKPHEKVLLVGHAGVYRCICAYILGIPLINIFKISVHYGQILKIKLGKNAAEDSIQSF